MIDIWKIKEGKLGIINFNNMLPCTSAVLSEVLPTIKDTKYKKLLENQISFLNADKDKIFKKAKLFHEQ